MKYFLILALCVGMVGIVYAGWWTDGFEEGRYYYEIRALKSNDKGVVEKIILENATVMKFKIIKDSRFKCLISEVVGGAENVSVKIKIYK